MLQRVPAHVPWYPDSAGPELLSWLLACPTSHLCRDSSCTFEGSGLLCGLERHAIKDVWRHLPEDSVVLELGARFGTVSCAISKRQRYSGLRISVEPDAEAFRALKSNVQRLACAGEVVHGAVSAVPLQRYEGGSKRSPGQHFRGYSFRLEPCGGKSGTQLCRGGAAEVPTYSIQALEARLGQRVGRPLRFSALVVDCEHCLRQLLREETAALQSPHLTHLFYEADEQSTGLVRDVCALGFGVLAAAVDCMLPRSALVQFVFRRGEPCRSWEVRASARGDCLF